MQQYASNHVCLEHLEAQTNWLERPASLEHLCHHISRTTHASSTSRHKEQLGGLRASTTHEIQCLQPCLSRAPRDISWLEKPASLEHSSNKMPQTMAASSTSRHKHGLESLLASGTNETRCLQPCMPRAPRDTNKLAGEACENRTSMPPHLWNHSCLEHLETRRATGGPASLNHP